MLKYIIRRLLWAIPVLFAVGTVTFFLARALPGGPFDFAGDRSLPESVVRNLERKYNLDWPLWKQFLAYWWDLLRGDLGPSFRSRSLTVNDIIKQTFPVSFQLGVLSLLLGLAIGLPAGIIAALNHNTWLDYTSSFIAILGVSIPNIVLGPFLIWLFGVKLGWLPVARWGADYTEFYLGFIPPMTTKFWQHAVLPTITLGTALSASIARLTRASLLQVIREDYIRTARAKGLRERSIILGHALKNALIPVVTILGPLFAAVVTGSFITEQIFGINGLGRHFVQSVTNRDYPVIMGTALLYAVLLIIANLVVDVLYAWLDPRIRYE
ncbi:MAG: ABC transporter permease [Ardenticatenia bacterium]|nr:ABC transporter permease [Ardenticatenia bacterium]